MGLQGALHEDGMGSLQKLITRKLMQSMRIPALTYQNTAADNVIALFKASGLIVTDFPSSASV
ncbi:hypothetical protein GCM10028807_44550 [Spirosoma daeguense]